ncbi:MAG: hypothetical protein R2713_02000 [Ilumatobacteraceae bacterium]
MLEGAYLWSRQPGMAVQLFVPDGGSVAGRSAVALRVTSNLRFSTDTANAEYRVNPPDPHSPHQRGASCCGGYPTGPRRICAPPP